MTPLSEPGLTGVKVSWIPDPLRTPARRAVPPLPPDVSSPAAARSAEKRRWGGAAGSFHELLKNRGGTGGLHFSAREIHARLLHRRYDFRAPSFRDPALQRGRELLLFFKR